MLQLAREADWEAVRAISVQVHDLHAAWRPDLYFHCDEPYPKEKFLEDMRNRLVYTAKINEIVVGYVIVSILQKGGPGTVEYKSMRLDVICVDEHARRQGIGKAMIADLQALAHAFGCKELILGVHPENDSAISFYQKCGFCIRTINMDMKI